MSMQDPVADMLSRIKNAQARMKREVSMPSSKFKVAIAEILRQEGYVAALRVDGDGAHKTLTIDLKYFEGRPVIDRLERVSAPSLRRYRSKDDLPKVMGGLGVAIVSTPRGLLTDREARAQGVGGEVLCVVS